MDKYKETKKKWTKAKRICKNCLTVVQNGSKLRHETSKKHIQLTTELSEKYTPMNLRLKRAEMRKIYNI